MGLGVRDHDHPAAKYAQGDEPEFTVIKPVIQERDSFTGKYLLNSHEVDAMLLNVGLPLGLVPFISHGAIVATLCSYVKHDQEAEDRSQGSEVRRQAAGMGE